MTKEFIDENMFNSKGKLKPGIAKKFNSSNQELYNNILALEKYTI